jgi:hypothetical protein
VQEAVQMPRFTGHEGGQRSKVPTTDKQSCQLGIYMLYITAVTLLFGTMPVLVRSWNGDLYNVQDVAEMFTDILCMKEACKLRL